MTLVVIDAVGLTPRALKHMPRLVEARRATASRRALDPIVPAVTCSVQATFAHRPDARRPRHRRQRLVLPRPRRGLPLAPAQQARAGREGVGDRAPRQARLPRREPRAGGTRWARPTDLTVTPRPIYHADGRKSPDCYTFPPQLHDNLTGPLGDVPAVPVLGPDGEHQVDQVDRRRGEDRARQRAARPAAGLPAAPGLRPPALRP